MAYPADLAASYKSTRPLTPEEQCLEWDKVRYIEGKLSLDKLEQNVEMTMRAYGTET